MKKATLPDAFSSARGCRRVANPQGEKENSLSSLNCGCVQAYLGLDSRAFRADRIVFRFSTSAQIR